MKQDGRVAPLVERLMQYREDAELTKLFPWPIDKNKLDTLQTLVSNSGWVDEIRAIEVNFQKTLTLRRNIPNEMMGALNNEVEENKKLKIAMWIIRDWGGITRGTDEKLKACLQTAERAALSDKDLPFDRIASWSKYLAFKYPQRFAIYDARVIYSLNWLLFRMHSRPYFPIPLGRNSLLTLLDYLIALLFDCNCNAEITASLDQDIRKRVAGGNSYFSGQMNKKTFFQKKEYSEYCNLLQSIAQGLYGSDDSEGLIKVEMILFSLADREIASEVLDFFSRHMPSSDR